MISSFSTSEEMVGGRNRPGNPMVADKVVMDSVAKRAEHQEERLSVSDIIHKVEA